MKRWAFRIFAIVWLLLWCEAVAVWIGSYSDTQGFIAVQVLGVSSPSQTVDRRRIDFRVAAGGIMVAIMRHQIAADMVNQEGQRVRENSFTWFRQPGARYPIVPPPAPMPAPMPTQTFVEPVHFAGFQVARILPAPYDKTFFGTRAIVIPCWFPVLLMTFPPALWLRQAIRHDARRRCVQKGLCPQCGYDLRMSPDRCPECGAPSPAKENPLPA